MLSCLMNFVHAKCSVKVLFLIGCLQEFGGKKAEHWDRILVSDTLDTAL